MCRDTILRGRHQTWTYLGQPETGPGFVTTVAILSLSLSTHEISPLYHALLGCIDGMGMRMQMGKPPSSGQFWSQFIG